MDKKNTFLNEISNTLETMRDQGLYKEERIITSQQSSDIIVNHNDQQINFCANNYLGLANSPQLMHYAKEGIDQYGFGLASVRFICGTQNVHKELEQTLSSFLKMEDCILYSSCFDANTGLFETLLSQEDAIISDQLNHASIIDGVRLCKAKRYRYANNNMTELEACLIDAHKNQAKTIMIVTDGVFSMDGIIANLAEICALAEKYQAFVVVDDSHAIGFVGDKGRGTPEYCRVMDKVDIITGTLGKALGGASGGFTLANKKIIDLLRQRSRPYLFSNTLAPLIAYTSIKAIDMIYNADQLRERLWHNVHIFREAMSHAGFTLGGKDHAIIPIMIGDAQIATQFARQLLQAGIYVIAFSYPVVPKEQARIRIQISAIHTEEQLSKAIDIFTSIGKNLGII